MPPPSATTPAAAVLPPQGSEQYLYLVDLSGYVFRAYHAIAPLSSSKGEPTHAVMGTVNMLQKIVTGRRPRFFAVAMDSKGKTFRHDLDPRYKAQRPETPPDLSQQMKRCEEVVRAYGIPVYQMNRMEADDLIATVTRRALAAGLGVVIVSSDKDLMQLVRDDDARVLLWDTMRDRVYGPEEVRAKWGVRPSRLHNLLALVGDTSDNVPGGARRRAQDGGRPPDDPRLVRRRVRRPRLGGASEASGVARRARRGRAPLVQARGAARRPPRLLRPAAADLRGAGHPGAASACSPSSSSRGCSTRGSPPRRSSGSSRP